MTGVNRSYFCWLDVRTYIRMNIRVQLPYNYEIAIKLPASLIRHFERQIYIQLPYYFFKYLFYNFLPKHGLTAVNSE